MSYPDGSLGFNLRQELRRESLEDEEDFAEPVNVADFSYGDYRLVGHGRMTNRFCGRFMAFRGCIRTELHNKSAFDKRGVLVNYSGKAYVRKVHHWCNKPSCPVCFKHGWALREAGNIESRLLEASKRFGQVEHIVCSVPSRDYRLDLKRLRQKAVKTLKARGVVGGVLMFHGFRLDKARWRWFWAPHFHVLGYILGGYGKCRGCKRKWDCLKGCGGFDDRSYQSFLKDGYYVKVLGERKTVFGTAWYQLNHASFKVSSVRSHVATWYGICSYRKLKVTVEKREELCPICRHELEKLNYFGVREFVTDSRSPHYRRDSFEDYEEDGRPVWVVSVSDEPGYWKFGHGY